MEGLTCGHPLIVMSTLSDTTSRLFIQTGSLCLQERGGSITGFSGADWGRAIFI